MTPNAKSMARILREQLNARTFQITHAQCLEIVAAQLGFRDWNTLAAQSHKPSSQDGNLYQRPLEPLPDGWSADFQSQTASAGIDRMMTYQGEPSFSIRGSSDKEPTASADLLPIVHAFRAHHWRGKTVELTAYLKSDSINGRGTIWIQTLDRFGGRLNLDNMERRAVDGMISGTQDWVKRQVIIPVQPRAETIELGAFLRGCGVLWATAFSIQEVAIDALPAWIGILPDHPRLSPLP